MRSRSIFVMVVVLLTIGLFVSCSETDVNHKYFSHIGIISDPTSFEEDSGYFVVLGYYDSNGDFICLGADFLAKNGETLSWSLLSLYKTTLIITNTDTPQKGNWYSIEKSVFLEEYEEPKVWLLSKCKETHPSDYTYFLIDSGEYNNKILTTFVCFQNGATWQDIANDFMIGSNFSFGDNNEVFFPYHINYINPINYKVSLNGQFVSATDKIGSEAHYGKKAEN